MKEEMTSFMKEMEDLANKSSVYLVDIEPRRRQKPGASLRNISITLNCEAPDGTGSGFYVWPGKFQSAFLPLKGIRLLQRPGLKPCQVQYQRIQNLHQVGSGKYKKIVIVSAKVVKSKKLHSS